MRRCIARFIRVACLAIAIAGFTLVASAEDWKKGQAPVDSVDVLARTITLDDEIYRVPPSCRIHRVSGVRLPLSELRVAIRPGVQDVRMSEVDFVRYEAIKKRRGWEMVEITILDQAPE